MIKRFIYDGNLNFGAKLMNEEIMSMPKKSFVLMRSRLINRQI